MDPKCLGSYKVINGIDFHTDRLEVAEGMRWHKVVHATLLKVFRRLDKAPDISKDNEEIWEVEEIVNSRRVKGVVRYRV